MQPNTKYIFVTSKDDDTIYLHLSSEEESEDAKITDADLLKYGQIESDNEEFDF
jgi:hypothetical protein